MNRKNIAIGVGTVGLLVAATLLASRGGRPGAAAKPKARPTIGVSVLTLTNPFFIDMADAMRDEAARHGMDVVVTAGERDVARQKNQVGDFIVRDVDAIVLCPTDSRAIGTSIAEANRAGIPVFTADVASLAPDAKVVNHTATDNYGGGKEAGVAMIEALGGRGAVAVLDMPEVESVQLRTKGFEEVIARHNAEGRGQIVIVAKLPGGGAKDQSFKSAEDVLQAHPDLAGIFAINDPSALGAVAALEKAGKLSQVKVIGFDGMPEGKRAIRDGKVYADPAQFPDRIGREAVRAVVAYLDGQVVPPQTLIPTALYRKGDAENDPALRGQ